MTAYDNMVAANMITHDNVMMYDNCDFLYVIQHEQHDSDGAT
jgi:hypothetical protein